MTATESGSGEVSGASSDSKPLARKADPIGRALRVAYDDMLREDIPDDFMDLLGKLD